MDNPVTVPFHLKAGRRDRGMGEPRAWRADSVAVSGIWRRSSKLPLHPASMPHPRMFDRQSSDREPCVRSSETGWADHAELFIARLTMDETPDVHGRIKIAAFSRDRTLTDVLAELLQQAFPEEGETS